MWASGECELQDLLCLPQSAAIIAESSTAFISPALNSDLASLTEGSLKRRWDEFVCMHAAAQHQYTPSC